MHCCLAPSRGPSEPSEQERQGDGCCDEHRGPEGALHTPGECGHTHRLEVSMCGFKSILPILTLPQPKKELHIFPLQADALSNTYESMCQQQGQEPSGVEAEEEGGAGEGAAGSCRGRGQGHSNSERSPFPHIFKPQVVKAVDALPGAGAPPGCDKRFALVTPPCLIIPPVPSSPPPCRMAAS